MTWEVSKKAFLVRFFPREKREANLVEFINLRQGGMSVLELSLKFTKLSKYTYSLVSYSRDEVNRFVMGASDKFHKECHSAMIHDNMTIYNLMVHA